MPTTDTLKAIRALAAPLNALADTIETATVEAHDKQDLHDTANAEALRLLHHATAQAILDTVQGEGVPLLTHPISAQLDALYTHHVTCATH